MLRILMGELKYEYRHYHGHYRRGNIYGYIYRSPGSFSVLNCWSDGQYLPDGYIDSGADIDFYPENIVHFYRTHDSWSVDDEQFEWVYDPVVGGFFSLYKVKT